MSELKNRNLTWLEKFAKSLQRQKFYGKLELTYRQGKIIGCKKTESIKPEPD